MESKPRPRGVEVAELATRQHGVVSVRQLHGIGYSDGAIAKAVGGGRLHRLHRGVYAAGLPRPAANLNVAGYELDVYWPELRFAVELDAFETHGGRESFEADRFRQEDLKLVGVEITRVTGSRLEREPERVIERVARLLEQRRRQLQGAEP